MGAPVSNRGVSKQHSGERCRRDADESASFRAPVSTVKIHKRKQVEAFDKKPKRAEQPDWNRDEAKSSSKRSPINYCNI